MSRESILAGQLRELGVVLFIFLASIGTISGHTVAAWSASFVAVGLLILALRSPKKSGWKKLTSLVRKTIGAIGGVLVAYAYVDSAQVETFMALATVAIPHLWSLVEKTDAGLTSTMILLVTCTAILPSCQSTNFEASIQSANGDAKAGLQSDGSNWKLWGAKDTSNGQEYRASVALPVIPGK